jgi:hypothetical protein
VTSSERWVGEIENACAEQDWVRSNHLITKLHYQLSEALADKLGRAVGPNFHSWAVWGSRKAGVTIRQEDLDSAISNATATAGIVGSVIGATVGIFAGRRLGWSPDSLTATIGASVGLIAGGYSGKQIAIWSRTKAAELILLGNQLVLRDIGTQSARFLELLENGATSEDRRLFFAGLRPGSTEHHGQDRLATVFSYYLKALDSNSLEVKREAMIAGNCEAVYHEHIRLEPYIRGAVPLIVRRCATQRLMTYEIGTKILTVGEDIPGVQTRTAVNNWTSIEERMRYVFALFREFHGTSEVFSVP